MTQPPVQLRPLPQDESATISKADRRRAPWRRRLVEAERGLTEGFRTDSTLVVHLFIATIVMAAALVLRISLTEWGLLILSFTVVFSAELFHLVIRSVIRNLGHHLSEPMLSARRIATAGVLMTLLGAITIVLLIFTPRLWDLFTRH